MTATTPRFSRTTHLVQLIAESERLAASLHGAANVPPGEGPDPTAEAALASLRLDGTPIDAVPDLGPANAVAAAPSPAPRTAPDHRGANWFEALRVLDDEPDEYLQALEFAGVITALASDDLAERLLTDARPALEELHRRLVSGLVAPDRAGAHRTAELAVHDASVGRIIYYPSAPAAIPGQLDLLAAWLGSAGAREHGLVVSGVVHLELLRIHPFDAANGRLARSAARLVLRARGLDPHGLAAPEPALAADPIGYYTEVASTLRRRDLSIWLERWGEAVTDGLRTAARSLGRLPDRVPDRAASFLAARPDPAFTVADYRAELGLGPADTHADLRELLDAGRVRRVPGTRGLRFTITAS